MAKNLDKVTLEIIWGKLQATADEMGVVLAKASMSPVIYEVLDFACGLCDSSGEMIVVQNGITIFTGTFSDDVKAVKDKFKNNITEGDIFVFNETKLYLSKSALFSLLATKVKVLHSSYRS